MASCKKVAEKFTINDFARSGIQPPMISKLGVKPLTESQTGQAVNIRLPGYLIPYYSIEGNETDYYRVKLELPPSGTDVLTGSGEIADQLKLGKYRGPYDKAPQVYYPPILMTLLLPPEDEADGADETLYYSSDIPLQYDDYELTWENIQDDASIAITIVEGEKKAAALCQAGIPAVGISGVLSFTTKATDTEAAEILDGLKDLNLYGRPMIVTFDNDIHINTAIVDASEKLCKLLTDEGAIVYTRHIPVDLETPDRVPLDRPLSMANVDKVVNLLANKSACMGADDFIVRYSVADFLNIPTPSYNYGVLMRHMSNKYANIKGSFVMLDEPDAKPMSIFEFRAKYFHKKIGPHIKYNLGHFEKLRSQTKEGKDIPAAALSKLKQSETTWAEAYTEYPLRSQYDGFEYEPTEPKVIHKGNKTYYNAYIEDAPLSKPYEPVEIAAEEDIDNVLHPILKAAPVAFRGLINNLFGHLPPHEIDYFLKWMALCVTQKTVKHHSLVFIVSPTGGVGKSILCEIMAGLVGESNSREGVDSDFKGQFNSIVASKRFIFYNEVSNQGDTTREKMRLESVIKNLVTQETITINGKFQTEYTIKNYVNYVFTANYKTGLSIQQNDRRVFALDASRRPLTEEQVMQAATLKTGDGQANLMYFFEQLDTSDFIVKGAPPKTALWHEIVDACSSPGVLKLKRLLVGETIVRSGLGSQQQQHDYVFWSELDLYEFVKQATGSANYKLLHFRDDLTSLADEIPRIAGVGPNPDLYIIKDRGEWLNEHDELKVGPQLMYDEYDKNRPNRVVSDSDANLKQSQLEHTVGNMKTERNLIALDGWVRERREALNMAPSTIQMTEKIEGWLKFREGEGKLRKTDIKNLRAIFDKTYSLK